MCNAGAIQTPEELEFAVFCIENVAIRLEANPTDVYRALTEESNLLNEYIVPGYEALHTQSKDYIVDEIIEVMQAQGVAI